MKSSTLSTVNWFIAATLYSVASWSNTVYDWHYWVGLLALVFAGVSGQQEAEAKYEAARNKLIL